MDILSIKNWLIERYKERTTWDGHMLILVGLAIFLLKPLLTLVAWAAIGYGLWTSFTPELKDTLEKLELGERVEKLKSKMKELGIPDNNWRDL